MHHLSAYRAALSAADALPPHLRWRARRDARLAVFAALWEARTDEGMSRHFWRICGVLDRAGEAVVTDPEAAA